MIFNYSFKTSHLWVIVSILTAASLFFKPSFFQAFGPAVTAIVIFDFLTKKINFKKALSLALVLTPALFVVLLQTYRTFFSGSNGEEIIIAPFKVWGYYSKSPIPVSIVITIAFPLFVFIFCRKDNDKTLLYAFIYYFMAALEYALLSEGWNWGHGNFGWCYNLSIGILQLSAVLHFVRYRKRNAESNCFSVQAISYIGYSLAGLHLIWGIWYYFMLLIEKPWPGFF